MKTETEKAINVNIVMGDLEYLIRDGLDDPRALTKKGLKITKKILRDAYTLLQQGEKYEKMWKSLFQLQDTKYYTTYKSRFENRLKMIDIENQYFHEEGVTR